MVRWFPFHSRFFLQQEGPLCPFTYFTRERSQKFKVMKFWNFGSEKCGGFLVANFLLIFPPKTSLHSSPQEKKFVTWSSLWEHSRPAYWLSESSRRLWLFPGSVRGFSRKTSGKSREKLLENFSWIAKCYKFWGFGHRERQTCQEPSVDTAGTLSRPSMWGVFAIDSSSFLEFFWHLAITGECFTRLLHSREYIHSIHTSSGHLSGTGDSQRDSRESIRANHWQLKPLFS